MTGPTHRRLQARQLLTALEDITIIGTLSNIRPERKGRTALICEPGSNANQGGRLQLSLPEHTWNTLEAEANQLQLQLADGITVTITGRWDWWDPSPTPAIIATTARLTDGHGAPRINDAVVARTIDTDGRPVDPDTVRPTEPATPTRQQLPEPATIATVAVIAPANSDSAADINTTLDHANLAHSGLDHSGLRLLWHHPRFDDPHDIATTLRTITKADLIIISRGGGDPIWLNVFNDPALVDTVAQHPIPIWTGIGHATNHTLVDDAAQKAFPTPTAVAMATAANHHRA